MITESQPTPHNAHAAIGVFGGTFDPIHFGHLRLAETLADSLQLSEVRFVPSGTPPHRAAPRTAVQHRLHMAERAVAGNPRFCVDAREVTRSGLSYTVDTLAALRAEQGDATPIWLLLGADAFAGLTAWHDWQRLFALANLAVAARAGEMPALDTLPASLRDEVSGRLQGAGAAGAVRFCAMTPLAISATAIRAACEHGESVRYLLPDTVLHYINEQKLYTHG